MIIPSRPMNYAMAHYRRSDTEGSDTLSTMWVKHENDTSLQKLDWRQQRTWSRKSDNCRYQQRCRRSRSSYKFQGTEEDELSNSLKVWTVQSSEFTCPRHRDKFWQMRLSHHYVPVYSERMRRENCQKMETRIVAQYNRGLERTRSNTPKYMGS